MHLGSPGSDVAGAIRALNEHGIVRRICKLLRADAVYKRMQPMLSTHLLN